MVTIIIIAVLVLLVIWGISVQNGLVQKDEISKNALKQINVQQMSRFDALKAIVQMAREYASYESETMIKTMAARNMNAGPNPTAKDIQANEDFLTQVTSRIMAVAEAYPQLKAGENYKQAMEDIKSYEENVRLARMTYNDTVTKFNTAVRQFPGSVVASLLHFPPKDYLEEDRSKADFPTL